MLQKLQDIRANKKQGDGFTIIEVMIVLAIAGLILVVVLVAIPQLQASQRDSARRDAVNRFVAEVANYSSNNNGRTPFGASAVDSTFTGNYLSNVDLANPSTGNQYVPTLATAVGDNPTADQIMVYRGGTCDGESLAAGAAIDATGNSRVFAVRVSLDRGGTYYCADNQ